MRTRDAAGDERVGVVRADAAQHLDAGARQRGEQGLAQHRVVGSERQAPAARVDAVGEAHVGDVGLVAPGAGDAGRLDVGALDEPDRDAGFHERVGVALGAQEVRLHRRRDRDAREGEHDCERAIRAAAVLGADLDGPPVRQRGRDALEVRAAGVRRHVEPDVREVDREPCPLGERRGQVDVGVRDARGLLGILDQLAEEVHAHVESAAEEVGRDGERRLAIPPRDVAARGAPGGPLAAGDAPRQALEPLAGHEAEQDGAAQRHGRHPDG